MGVFPTKAPSIQICAADGIERNNSLPASLPARCSSALRLTTSGGGPAGTVRCGELFWLLELSFLTGMLAVGNRADPAAAAVVAEGDVERQRSDG